MGICALPYSAAAQGSPTPGPLSRDIYEGFAVVKFCGSGLKRMSYPNGVIISAPVEDLVWPPSWPERPPEGLMPKG